MANPQAFEDHLAALQGVVEELEGGGLKLDEQLARYQDGIERLKACHEMLAAAEARVKKLVRDSRGMLREDPLVADDPESEGGATGEDA